MSAACLTAVLYTAASVSLVSTFSRATPAALSRSAAIRMDVSARRHGNAASTSSLQAAAASVGEQTRDSEPDEDVSILYHAAESVGPAHERSGLRSAAPTMDQLFATRSAAEQRRAYEELTRDGEEDAANAPWPTTQNRGLPLRPAQPQWQPQAPAPSSAAAPAPYAAPPAAAWRGTAAGLQQRSAPDILLGGLDNLGKDPLGWCFGPPSPLYSNAGSAPAAGPPAAGLQPPNAAAPAAAVGVSQPASNEGEATRDIEVSVAQAEATRCEEEELEAKRAWLAKASGSRGR